MPKEEKGEKMVKVERVRERGRTFLEVISLILILIIVILLLVVFQIPYTTTNAVSETVPVENCSQGAVPYIATFRTGLTFDGAPRFNSSNGVALIRYSDLRTNAYVTIRNTGNEEATYCVKAQTYAILGFANEQQAILLSDFQGLIDENASGMITELDNQIPNSEFCTENPIPPKLTDTISFWTPTFVSDNALKNYNENEIYVLLTVMPPLSKNCVVEYVNQSANQQVVNYCSSWKYILGKC